MTSSILIKNADYLVTMDQKRRILRNASLYIENQEIKEINSQRKKADKIINALGMIVLPGFINCHHHMFQSLFRNVPYQQNQKIENWIEAMTAMAGEITPEASYWSAVTAMAELLLSGCTTNADFFYLSLDNKDVLEGIIKAAKDIGIRFHFYQESETIVKEHHQSEKFSMLRVGLGICAPFTKPKRDFEKMAKLARKYGANLQVHVAESEFEKRPVFYLQDVGWQGPDVSYVHCLYLDQEEIKTLVESHTSVVHCPVSNARGEGIAPITEMMEAGVNVGIGVDGSAGNDSSNMLEEMRWARTLQGARDGFTYLKQSQVLEMGTIGGAKVLNRDDIGSLEEGKAADIAIFDTRDKISHAGAVCDPVGSLIASQAIPAEYVIINGKIVVEDKKLKTVDLQNIIENQNRLAGEIIKKVEEKTGRLLTKVQWVKAIKD